MSSLRTVTAWKTTTPSSRPIATHFVMDRQRLDRIRTAAANPGSLEKVEFHQARRTDDDFPGSKTNINRAVMEAQGRGLWAME